MTDSRTHQPRARAERDEPGLDVWLPALVAIVAALFLIWSANAQEAAPRPIYSAERFAMSAAERTLLEQEAARAAANDAARIHASRNHVEMRALPELAVVSIEETRAVTTGTPAPTSSAPILIADPEAGDAAPGWLRLAMALVIAAMLGGALWLLDRTWRRTGPPLTASLTPGVN